MANLREAVGLFWSVLRPMKSMGVLGATLTLRRFFQRDLIFAHFCGVRSATFQFVLSVRKRVSPTHSQEKGQSHTFTYFLKIWLFNRKKGGLSRES